MKLSIAAFLLSTVYGQQQECMYKGGPDGEYMLNLTSVSGYRLEHETPQHFYYYTPCRNGEQCPQGNANFYGNAVQFQPGSNQCEHYLSVDHHDRPEYFFGTAAWIFRYEDGEICDATQQPRRTNVYMLCDEFMSGGAYLYDAEEPQKCNYALSVRTPLACVPENSHHAKCQWKYTDSNGDAYRLDLSSLKGSILRGPSSQNGYEQYYSPCENGLHCYQQTGDGEVMSILENRVTGTCEHYLSVWQEGRVEPLFHDSSDAKSVHWSFHYFLDEKCSDGTQGEQTIRWYCDSDVGNYSVINATYDGGCRWEMNVASQYACPNNQHYTHHEGFDMSTLRKGKEWLVDAGKNMMVGKAKKLLERILP